METDYCPQCKKEVRVEPGFIRHCWECGGVIPRPEDSPYSDCDAQPPEIAEACRRIREEGFEGQSPVDNSRYFYQPWSAGIYASRNAAPRDLLPAAVRRGAMRH